MGLRVPPEPREIKEFIVDVRRRVSGSYVPVESYDALAVWAFNKLPKYLWVSWREDLKMLGISWQRFLKILNFHTNDMILWAIYDRMSWDELVSRIIETINRYKVTGGVG